MRKYILVLLLILFWLKLDAQEVREKLSGQVSFVSSQNIYVKFKSTSGISAGDTLYSQSNDGLIPVLTVKNLSSSSCVCEALSKTIFSIGNPLIARVKTVSKKMDQDAIRYIEKEISLPESLSDSSGKKLEADVLKQKVRGRISLNSYSDLSNTGADNSHRFRYTFSLDAKNLGNSKFSLETYLSFKHKFGEWQEIKDNVFNALKIYNLAVKYDLNESTQIRLGRMINPRISSLGAMDGLQVEKSFNKLVFGVLAGSRPDYINYGFDAKLLQYGAFAAFNTKVSKSYTETSIAFVQQFNNLKTDRRFLYFQHSNTIVKNLNFIGTLEADLYEQKTDSLNIAHPQTIFNLTGLYASLSYRPGRNLSLSGSYDARRNVIYYETYKTFVDRILENELRQGFRVQASYRILRDLRVGLQSGYRYLKTDPHPSRNIYGYLTYSQIPVLNISATVSATLIESSYINGNIYSINLSRGFLKNKVQSSIGYRYVDYRLPENLHDLLQNVGEANISWQIFDDLSFSMSYEGTFETQNQYHRVYMQIRKRF